MIDNPSSYNQRFEEAEAMEDRGDHIEALNEWRDLASKHTDAAVLIRQARLAQQLGYTEEAERAFRRAIEVEHEHSWAFVGLASLLMKRGEYDEAARLLRRSLAYEKSPITQTMLGVALMSLERNEEAVDNLRAAINLDPAYEEAYFNLAELTRKTDKREAEQLLMKALQLDPEYSDAHRELGWLLSESEKNPSPTAEYHIRRSIELESEDPLARIYLGNLLWKRGDVSDSIREFEAAIRLMPNRSMPIWSLANLYEAQESWTEAEELYERAIKTEPDDEIAHMNFGRMLKKRGRTAEAMAHLKLALSIDPDYTEVQKLISEIVAAGPNIP